MGDSEARVVLGAATIHVGAMGMHRYACEFLSAALNFTPCGDEFSPVPYYLICRSIELSLKSYLLARGVMGRPELRSVLGHNLVRALDRAEAAGLGTLVDVSPAERAELQSATTQYSNKEFEYFENIGMIFGGARLPDLEVLAGLAARLADELEQPCFRSTAGHIGPDGHRTDE